MSRDWLDWHARYEDPASSISQRLPVVRRFVREVLAEREHARILSLCSGDGRDLLPILDEAPGRHHARLIELDETLAAAAAAQAPDGVEVVMGDAALTDNYAGAVPADLVLACGIFGNVAAEDVERFLRALPQLLAEGGAVVWTRHRRPPDLTPSIRAWLAEAGFRERGFESGPETWAVGCHELTAAPQPLVPGRRLFSFV